MSVKLYDLNMVEINLRGVTWLEFTPDPPSVDRITDNVWDGDIVLGKKRNSRNIQARLMYQSISFNDYQMLRDELFMLLDPLKEIYVVEDKTPGKRWRVDVDGYKPERVNGRVAEVSVMFYSNRPHAESIGTTMDASTFNARMRDYGTGILVGASSADYIYEATDFNIHNAGSVVVDPRKSDLLITFECLTFSSGAVSITNNTTGDVWSYDGPFVAGDIVTIDRTKSKKNGVNIVGETNHGLISLAKGTNNITVAGVSGDFEIKFEFRYLYL